MKFKFWLHGREHFAQVTLGACERWQKQTGRNLQSDLFRYLAAMDRAANDPDLKNVFEQYLVLYDVLELETAKALLLCLTIDVDSTISINEINDAFYQTQQNNLGIVLQDPDLAEKNAPWPYVFVNIAHHHFNGHTSKKKEATETT